MPAKPRRGEIRIDVTPSTTPGGPSPAAERPSLLPKLVGPLIWLAIALVVYGLLPGNPETRLSPQAATDSSAAPSTTAGSVVPRPGYPTTTRTTGPGLPTLGADDDDDRRLYAPRYIQFKVDPRQQRNGSAAPAPYSVVFAYDQVRVVTLPTIEDIPLAERGRAITEIGTGVPTLRELKGSTTHIISGDITVTVGDLFGADDLSVRIATNSRDIRDVSLVLSSAPRGPPPRLLVPAAYALSSVQARPPSVYPASGTIFEAGVSLVDAWQPPAGLIPVRTIYVVGKIENFIGPSQFERSVLQAEVVDLGPRSMEAPRDQYLVESKPGYREIRENRTEPHKVEATVMLAAIAAATARPSRPTHAAGPGGSGSPTGDGTFRPGRTGRAEAPPYRPPPPRPRPAGRP